MPLPATVDDYIGAQPADAQPRLRELRAIVREALPDSAEGISYGMPTYRFGPGASYVSFGAGKHHCALYGSAVDQFPDELRDYKTSKGTVRFSLDRPIPAELVRKLVLAKVATRTGDARA
ncbi:MAG: DUF1801 domain-containing protein [Chloroflexi bacterium]|nr:DUF1801 domain-containing protein [Chloroflexota bacterium]